jgi:ABC-type antimicrobial peptide transport system permease subunit
MKEIPEPPQWATRLLRWYCAPHLLEEVEGDLREEFIYQVRQVGLIRAQRNYINNVFSFARPITIRRKSSSPSSPFPNMNMYKHYLTVALRNLSRQKVFSFINVTGLSLGMVCCLFIFLWVRDEERIDNFHANGDSLYRLYQTTHADGTVDGSYATPFATSSGDFLEALSFAEDLRHAVPEIKYATSYATGYELPWGHPETFQAGDKLYKFEGSRASEDFFKMLSYKLVAGDPENALKSLNTVAISRKMAEIFFESPEDAIGKSIRYENKLDFVITAVFENLPAESSLKFDFLISWETCKTRQIEFASNDWVTFFLLDGNADVKDTEAKINRWLSSKNIDVREGVKVEVGLQRYGDQYLFSNFVNGKPQAGRMEYVNIFSGVAVFILIMACINFMNLATARSIRRAREIGIRKVIGSSRVSLIVQFLGESLLLSLVGLILSVTLTLLLLPGFNSFTGKQITFSIFESSSWLFLLGLLLFTGVAAGSYPALLLSSFKPVRTLKGIVRFTWASIWLRKGLAGFQFALSIALMVATIVVSQQTGYVQKTHLGYDRENLLYIRVEGELNSKYQTFKEQVSRMPGIAMVDRSSEAPHAMGFTVIDAIKWEGKSADAAVGFKPTSVGFDFLKLMNLKITEGRGFSRTHVTDTAAFMLNEEAVKQMGLKQPIGAWVSAWDKKGHVIGILKDYHINSLHETIKPLIVDVKEDLYFGVIIVRTEPGKTEEALVSLEKIYKEINPNFPFDFQFVDQEYDKLYRNEQVVAKLSTVFAVLAITISCLGLLGLIMFSAEQRTKEIGIRKVLGASVAHIINLLSTDFLKLVVVAFVIAAPISGYFMDKWLQNFAFQIELSWWIFALAGVAALMIALLTVCVQAVQSAVANPVDSLRSE